jgi:SAM-dependent MidA family methyltransferase
MAGPEASADIPSWLLNPGEQDITAHVDFTSVKAAAAAAGLTTLGFLDQTYFLLALLTEGPQGDLENPENLKHRLALKTLLMPGGLGSSHKVLLLGKAVGSPALLGASYKMRIT